MIQVPVDNVWPASLPSPYIDYSGTPRNATLRSPEDHGRIFRRSRFSKPYATIGVVWHMTVAQLDTFQTFFNSSLGNGTAAFSIDLLYPKNSALQSWMVRLIGGYQTTYLEGVWEVQAQLDLIQLRSLPDPAEREGYVPFIPEQFIYLAVEGEEFLTSEGQQFALEAEGEETDDPPMQTSDGFDFYVIGE